MSNSLKGWGRVFTVKVFYHPPNEVSAGGFTDLLQAIAYYDLREKKQAWMILYATTRYNK